MTTASSVHYSVRILVPEPASASLDRWAEDAEGASMPQLGWHITLASSFESLIEEDRLIGLIGTIAARNVSFPLHLTEVIALPDVTRTGYSTVFLDCTDEKAANYAPVFDLQDDITATLAPVRRDAQSAVSEQPFRPHVTLALTVSELEANQLVHERATAGRVFASRIRHRLGARADRGEHR